MKQFTLAFKCQGCGSVMYVHLSWWRLLRMKRAFRITGTCNNCNATVMFSTSSPFTKRFRAMFLGEYAAEIWASEQEEQSK